MYYIHVILLLWIIVEFVGSTVKHVILNKPIFKKYIFGLTKPFINLKTVEKKSYKFFIKQGSHL